MRCRRAEPAARRAGAGSSLSRCCRGRVPARGSPFPACRWLQAASYQLHPWPKGAEPCSSTHPQRSWKKVRAQLFAAGPSGVARMEQFAVRDGSGPEKTSLRRGERRVLRLADCVSVGPAGSEGCPRGTAAFCLRTLDKSHVLAAEQPDEWVAQLCQLAFQVWWTLARGWHRRAAASSTTESWEAQVVLQPICPLPSPWRSRGQVCGLAQAPCVPPSSSLQLCSPGGGRGSPLCFSGHKGDGSRQQQGLAQLWPPHGGEHDLLVLART